MTFNGTEEFVGGFENEKTNSDKKKTRNRREINGELFYVHLE